MTGSSTSPRSGAAAAGEGPVAHTRVMRLRWLALHLAVFLVFSVCTTIIWLVTTRGYFWPEWVMFAIGVPLAIHAWVVAVDLWPGIARSQRIPRRLAIHEGVTVVLIIACTLLWLMTPHGYFWPVWPSFVLLLALGVHALWLFGPALWNGSLSERIASSRRRAPTSSISRRASCDASSAISTTGPRRVSSRSG